MNEISKPIFQTGTVKRQAKCRAEIDVAMHNLISAAVELGWLEGEVAMALADAAEDYVIALARSTPRQH